MKTKLRLAEFQSCFAHFTLPNGRERWLPIDLARKDSPHLDGYVWGIGVYRGERLTNVIETYSRQEAAVFLIDCGGWNKAELAVLEAYANACEHQHLQHSATHDRDYCLDCRRWTST